MFFLVYSSQSQHPVYLKFNTKRFALTPLQGRVTPIFLLSDGINSRGRVCKVTNSESSRKKRLIFDSCSVCYRKLRMLLYHRLMVPNWLRNNAKWNCSHEGDDLNLIIKADSSDWENIFRIPLIPGGTLQDNEDITVKMKVGVVLPEPEQPRDPMSYMISDGVFSVGIQLLDPNHDYSTHGPYRAVEGDSAAAKLRNPNVNVAATVASRQRTNPDQFELSFKPSELFGSAYCAIDDGHKIVAQYSDHLKLSKGLNFELYRYKKIERYTINYIEVTVYQDSPKV